MFDLSFSPNFMLFAVAALVQKTMVPPHYDLSSTAKNLSYLIKDLWMPLSIDHYWENKHKNAPFYWIWFSLKKVYSKNQMIMQNYICAINQFVIIHLRCCHL